MTENTISYFGNNRNTKTIFRSGIILLSFIWFAFFVLIASDLGIYQNNLLSTSIWIGMIGLFLVPLTNHHFKRRKTKRKIHILVSTAFFIFTTISLLIITANLISINSFLGRIAIILLTITLFETIVLIFKYNITFIPETFFALMIQLWVIFLTLGVIIF